MNKVTAPRCDACKKTLEDWSGNIMVPSSATVVDHFDIWCKECTRELDRKGLGKEAHNIWELSWAKNDFFSLLSSVVERPASGDYPTFKFTPKAMKEIINLGSILYKEKELEEDKY